MITADKLYIVTSIVITHGCHLALLIVSSFLFLRTKRVGFLFMVLGFVFTLIQPLALWLLSRHFTDSVERLTFLVRTVSFLYPLSLIMIIIGFYKLFISRDTRYEQ